MACELRIQELFNQIEPQWNRMAVDQEFMDAFFDINRGSGESAILAVRYCDCRVSAGLTDSTKQNWNEYWSFAERVCPRS